ncbi:MAG: PAS domain S-box protein [Spirochaetes bacterium]|jgi:PAS domain S-box-containing protein|nr:PAS domain S-box protein [Spirochaetota bacterium]
MSGDTEHRRILLVEDEAIIAMDEQRILESHDYAVDIVHSGEAGVAAVAGDDDIELVLMDIDLGVGMDGTEAARAILDIRDVPIVFLSSHTEKALVDQVRDITSYGYVVKNSGEFVLVQSIEMAFRLFGTTRELREENAQHRATRTSLAESRRFLSSTLEAIQDGISVLDSDLVVQHVNEVMNRWYEENAPLVGKKCYEVYHGRGEPCPNCPSLRALDTGNAESSVVPGLPGSPVRWVELFAYPMKDPASDEVTGVVEFVRDITERAERQRELRDLSRRSTARTQYLEAIFAAVPDAVITLDPDHHVMDWSPGAEAVFGYTLEEVKGCDIDDIVSGPAGEALEEAREFTARVSKEEVVLPTAAVRYRKDGSPVDVLFSSAPIIIEGQFEGVAAIYKDVTERVDAERGREAERERVERLLEERNLLFRETQHRIKNDLALVRSLLSMQASQTADPECRAVLEEAESRVTVMASVHDQLFRHAEVETVSMAQFIDSLLEELRQASSFPGMDVSVEAEAFSVPARVSVNVGIILNELLTNAMKHADEAGRSLRVRGRIGRRKDGSAVLSFRDTGAGFPDAVLSGEKRGLGLTIIEALASQHDGEVSFRNDGGAVVDVVLPLPTEAGG